MTLSEAMAQLESLGTAQNRKVYLRHGVSENVFGVSFADLGMLKKQIKTDHALARDLWATGNHDARILATMIADPKLADGALLDAWAADLHDYVVTDSLAGFTAKTALARDQMLEWMRSPNEWVASAGWNLLEHLAIEDGALADDLFAAHIPIIERSIHTSKNRVRHEMNGALIAIGIRSSALEALALTTAERIGKVQVDHGKTDCQTPDAARYIRKARERKKRSG